MSIEIMLSEYGHWTRSPLSPKMGYLTRANFFRQGVFVYSCLRRPDVGLVVREEPGSATSRTADASQLRMRPHG
jgi:hypothetical protein